MRTAWPGIGFLHLRCVTGNWKSPFTTWYNEICQRCIDFGMAAKLYIISIINYTTVAICSHNKDTSELNTPIIHDHINAHSPIHGHTIHFSHTRNDHHLSYSASQTLTSIPLTSFHPGWVIWFHSFSHFPTPNRHHRPPSRAIRL